MKKILFFLLVYGNLFALTGQEVLEKVEKSLTGFSDQTATCEVILGEKGVVKETRSMKIWSAGKSKRIVKFVSPSHVKDIGILVLSDKEMYIYLPAYKKTRRIEGNMKNQNFQGTDFSYREIGSYEYSKDFDSKIIKEDEAIIKLELTKKPSSDSSYTKIIMEVEKPNFLPKKLEMYVSDKLKKVLTIISTEKRNNYWALTHVKMEDLSKNHFTEIKMKEIVFDSGLERKGVFSERFLKSPL